MEQFNNPFILLLLASAIISLLMRQFDDAASIAFAIVIVVTVGFVQEYRSEKTLERMYALLPPICRCLRYEPQFNLTFSATKFQDKSSREGTFTAASLQIRQCLLNLCFRNGVVDNVFAKYLVPGDIVYLSVGDRIPADVRLVRVNELAVDESSFTGETEPKYKSTELRPEAAAKAGRLEVNDMNDVGFQGTLVINGNGVGVVVCTGERSQFGEVFRMMQAEDPPRHVRLLVHNTITNIS